MNIAKVGGKRRGTRRLPRIINGVNLQNNHEDDVQTAHCSEQFEYEAVVFEVLRKFVFSGRSATENRWSSWRCF